MFENIQKRPMYYAFCVAVGITLGTLPHGINYLSESAFWVGVATVLAPIVGLGVCLFHDEYYSRKPLPNNKLRSLSEKHKPPESWYSEGTEIRSEKIP